MNIFILDTDPKIAAQMHCERHLLKMIVEHTQMAFATYYHTLGISKKKQIAENQSVVDNTFIGLPRLDENGKSKPYAITHVNHPCTIWSRTNQDNFTWLMNATKALCQEYTYRYDKKHSVESIIDWMQQNPPKLALGFNITPFAQAMPKCFMSDNAVLSYRKYYAYKSTYMKVNWKKQERIPNWWTSDFVQKSIEEYKPN